MTSQAAAVFAQVIPVLLVAAFLSGVRINIRDRGTTIGATIYVAIASVAEGACLIYVAVDKPMPFPWMVGVLVAALILLVSLIATVIQKLYDDENHEGGRDGK